MSKIYLVLTAVGRDKVGTVEMLTDVIVSHSANIEDMETHVTPAPNSGTPLFSMLAKVQAPPNLSLGQLRRKLTDVGEEIDVDIEITLSKK